MGFEEDVVAVEALLMAEIVKLDDQIARSRALRGAPPYIYEPTPGDRLSTSSATSAINNAKEIEDKKKAQEDETKGTDQQSSSAASPSPQKQQGNVYNDPTLDIGQKEMLRQTMKAGPLQYFKKSFFGGGFEFCHFVVDETNGFRWYKSEREFAKNPTKPLGSLPFYTVKTNTRGSKFKEAAVVWPLITTQECPKATDPSKTYFGIQHHTPNDMETLILAASDSRDRDDWVFFLTKYVKLYIAMGEEFLPFASMKVGSQDPVHQREVLGGEAPGSPKRTNN